MGDAQGKIQIDGDIVQTGGILIEGNLAGDIVVDDLAGTVTIVQGVSGDIKVKGAVASTGGIEIDGALEDKGRVLIDGFCEGDITIREKTATLSLIHLLGGLGTGGSVIVNADEGNYNAEGTIHVGSALTQIPPAYLTFSGAILIHDDVDDQSHGDLKGTIKVVGCHAATAPDLDICICGNGSENVIIAQASCTNQVAWGCFTGCDN